MGRVDGGLAPSAPTEFRQSQYRCCTTTYLIVENGIIIKAFDKIKAADNTEQMLGVEIPVNRCADSEMGGALIPA